MRGGVSIASLRGVLAPCGALAAARERVTARIGRGTAAKVLGGRTVALERKHFGIGVVIA